MGRLEGPRGACRLMVGEVATLLLMVGLWLAVCAEDGDL